MQEGAKKRLIGAVVIVALAVIFVPMLFEPESLDRLPPIQQSIPRPPAFDPAVKAEVFLGPQDSGVGVLAEPGATVSQPLALPPPAEHEPVPSGTPGRPNTAGAKGAAGAAVGGAPAAKPIAGASSRTPVAVAEPAASKPVKVPAQAPGKPPAIPESAPTRGANAGMPSWVIQVASVANAEGAAELEGKLRAGGFPAFVEKDEVNGKVFYRVEVGPELDRARAEQTVVRLREKHKVDPLIKSYP